MSLAPPPSAQRPSRRGPEPPRDGLADKLPPQNLEAERGLLGSIVLDNAVLHEVVPLVNPEDFYRDAHQQIYREILRLYHASTPVDLITLADGLTRRGALDQVGGLDLLMDLVAATPHAVNAAYYAQIVRDKATKRHLIAAANQVLRDAYAEATTSEDMLDRAQRLVFEVADRSCVGSTEPITVGSTEALNQISARRRGTLPGVQTGLRDLDQLTGGPQPGQLIVIGARPSIGKTALAITIASHVAIVSRLATLFVSLEMGRQELGERILVARSGVDGQAVKRGRITESDFDRILEANASLDDCPLFIDDTPGRRPLEIIANARRLRARHQIGLVIVDYLQLIEAEDPRDSRQEQIAKTTRRLKVLARDLNVPVIALSQLNRKVEEREDKVPTLADLRESGAIEQDADMVWLLHRPEFYRASDRPGQAELIVAKQRNGATGSIALTYHKSQTRFSCRGPAAPEPVPFGAAPPPPGPTDYPEPES